MRIKVTNVLAIILGSAIMGFGVNYFNIANGLAEGGIMGVSLILNYVLGWNPGLTSILINIPLLLLGWKVMGRVSFIYAMIGAVSLSVFLYMFEFATKPLGDPLLASLYAGAFVGIGLGIVFRYGGMTDGMDVVAMLCKQYLGWSLGKTLFLTDAVIIVVSLVYLDLHRAMYTFIAITVGARLIDFVQEGSYSAKAATIISSQPEVIAAKVLEQMKRGVTFLNGKGAYTSEPKEIVYCVVSHREIGRLKTIVMEADPSAFVIFNDVHEVVGKGFNNQPG
ncbi:uncharacterized membrane-anchored protein YitT (DUF2179 family) [Paenibacillus phyllosphaerae]|uniref:Uncharacterized membrane-anchored protein YitT (DUF2179 family) n=1 Tax=Paenibacillus phyllosphaerae TaxID=274593 RepID=A0A7W5FL41_9BACL|nr:YitT family protein [Paenibacillus phyllosphaerae]MBB3108644.1 uncharacterized membrane-anchored protein YitT (DUF2179 family) [Paenibacillus phyllosphaerae]